MNRLRKQVEKFCYRHPRFGIPKLMLWLSIATAAVYIISLMDRSGTFLSLLLFDPSRIFRGEVWRLFSWVVIALPSGGAIWLFISLYFYYFIGSTLESIWGPGRFTMFYLLGVAMHLVLGMAVYLIFGNTLFLYPYYLNMSMFFAFAVLFPEQRVLLFFFIPIKVKWLAVADAVLIFFPAIRQAVQGNWLVLLLPVVSVLSFFVFCGSDLIALLRRTRAGQVSNVISFRKASRSVRPRPGNSGHAEYRHKCSVCGRTDTEHPELEFRYCSLCTGYHCFCSEHINSHVHFTE
ncbi:MAG: hypothetical protein IKH56_07325 [Oscillospiraceae bacterium]|nr:hypothetical protein [Oscillospiraceae bacterium]